MTTARTRDETRAPCNDTTCARVAGTPCTPARRRVHAPRGSHRARLGPSLGLLLGLLALAQAAFATPIEPRPLAPLPTEPIDCTATPFGRSLTLGEDAEFVGLLDYPGGVAFDGHHVLELSGDAQAPFDEVDGGTIAVDNERLAAIRADLDGDGEQEVVVASRIGSGAYAGDLRLEFWKRDASGQISAFSNWRHDGPFTAVDLAAGDFDGSQDGQQELAVAIQTADSPYLQVLVLTDGLENALTGYWKLRLQHVAIMGIAAGDFLLNGRDQIAVVAEAYAYAGDPHRKLIYRLLQYGLDMPAMMPPGPEDDNVWWSGWATYIDDTFLTGKTAPVGHTIGHEGFTGISVDAGDVAGDAAAELVVHYEFREDDLAYTLARRLHHFEPTRDASGAIEAIDFAVRPAAGAEYDDSEIVSDQRAVSGGWAVAVRNIDDRPHAEIVLARNAGVAPDYRLELAAYRAGPDLTAAFRYRTSGLTVQAASTSVGMGDRPFDDLPHGQPRWEFDADATSEQDQGVYTFDTEGAHQITLNLQQEANGEVSSDSHTETIVLDADGTSEGGGAPEGYLLQLGRDPAYVASRAGDASGRMFNPIAIDTGDMDRDGRVEILTLARLGTDNTTGSGFVRSAWHLEFSPTPPDPPHALSGMHEFVPTSGSQPNSGLAGLHVVAADIDGDSLHAEITGDCRRVQESQLRQLVWMPPFFARFQGDAERSASFGRSATGGSSTEDQFGTFTSHDVSGYIGTGLGFDFLGLLGVEAQVRATAGYYEQAANGGIAGSENSWIVSQGFTANGKDALLIRESNTFDCYTYDVMQAAFGVDPDSALRICEILENSTFLDASSPNYWDTYYPQASEAETGGYPPASWAPVTRDWDSISLFRSVSSNATFENGNGAAHATDGRFRTAVESAPMFQPYIEIDLGAPQPVSNIRIFPPRPADPPPGEPELPPILAADLSGFRVYVSSSPMPASGLPDGPDVREYAPRSAGDTVWDRWNVWTRVTDPDDPDAGARPIQARYIRLQSPEHARIRISEIQVFGDVHADPPDYPDAICDPVPYDGLFRAKVWDAASGHFRDVEARGDLLWNGTGPEDGLSWEGDGQYLASCINHVRLVACDGESDPECFNFSIHPTTAIGEGGYEWSFGSENITHAGELTSFENSTRVGAEFDLGLTAFVGAVFGGSEEFTSGVTEEHQTVTFWGAGVEVGGSTDGFQSPYDVPRYIDACRYNARPYGYQLVERSNTGYEHVVYAVDYVVPEEAPDGSDIGATAWTRADLPPDCGTGSNAYDPIFRSGFDGP